MWLLVCPNVDILRVNEGHIQPWRLLHLHESSAASTDPQCKAVAAAKERQTNSADTVYTLFEGVGETRRQLE